MRLKLTLPRIAGMIVILAALVGRPGIANASTTWNVVHSPNAGSRYNDLVGVAANSSSHVWTAGSQAEGTQTLAEHWNGTTSTAVTTPNPVGPAVGNSYLTGVTALSTNDVWSVGTSLNFVEGSLQQTVGEQWNGASWSVVSTPNAGTGSTRGCFHCD